MRTCAHQDYMTTCTPDERSSMDVNPHQRSRCAEPKSCGSASSLPASQLPPKPASARAQKPLLYTQRHTPAYRTHPTPNTLLLLVDLRSPLDQGEPWGPPSFPCELCSELLIITSSRSIYIISPLVAASPSYSSVGGCNAGCLLYTYPA